MTDINNADIKEHVRTEVEELRSSISDFKKAGAEETSEELQRESEKGEYTRFQINL